MTVGSKSKPFIHIQYYLLQPAALGQVDQHLLVLLLDEVLDLLHLPSLAAPELALLAPQVLLVVLLPHYVGVFVLLQFLPVHSGPQPVLVLHPLQLLPGAPLGLAVLLLPEPVQVAQAVHLLGLDHLLHSLQVRVLLVPQPVLEGLEQPVDVLQLGQGLLLVVRLPSLLLGYPPADGLLPVFVRPCLLRIAQQVGLVLVLGFHYVLVLGLAVVADGGVHGAYLLLLHDLDQRVIEVGLGLLLAPLLLLGRTVAGPLPALLALVGHRVLLVFLIFVRLVDGILDFLPGAFGGNILLLEPLAGVGVGPDPATGPVLRLVLVLVASLLQELQQLVGVQDVPLCNLGPVDGRQVDRELPTEQVDEFLNLGPGLQAVALFDLDELDVQLGEDSLTDVEVELVVDEDGQVSHIAFVVGVGRDGLEHAVEVFLDAGCHL